MSKNGSNRPQNFFKILGLGWDDLEPHLKPFNAECRAYGRLKETGNEHLAVKCFGYLKLDKETYPNLMEELGLPKMKWMSDEYEYDHGHDKEEELFPIDALVKELKESSMQRAPHTSGQFPRMGRDLKELHRLGIVCQDVRSDNYINGQLVDLGDSITGPHLFLDETSGLTTLFKMKTLVWLDYAAFDEMTEIWNGWNDRLTSKEKSYSPDKPQAYVWFRMLSNPDVLLKLRGGRALCPPSFEIRPSSKELRERDERQIKYWAHEYDWEGAERKCERKVSGVGNHSD